MDRIKKLIVVIMGPGKKHFADMCLESVKDADEILYWTNNKEFIFKFHMKNIFYNDWDETDPTTNGKCRQRYLEYLKEYHTNDWCLVIDEDEIVEDLSKVKQFIQTAEPGLYGVKMRHFIGNIGHEDATKPVHIVPCRLFKISEATKYPEHSHPVLEGKYIKACLKTTIWHLGHLPVEYMDYILKRYNQHAKDSVIHTPEFLKQWKISHLVGMYPIKQINPMELPDQICDRYGINKDEFYFINRGVETKHFIMVKQWKEYFKNKEVLDCGCGRGPFIYAWETFDIRTSGFDKSKFAVLNSLSKNGNIWVADVLDEPLKIQYELVTAIDLLEHLQYEDVDKAIKNISKMSKKNVLFSIPYLYDPNLENDPTHIIKEDKEWWLEKLSKYFKVSDAPTNWLFHEQLLIGEKK